MDILSFIVIGFLAVLGVSALVEFYKKTIRKGQAGAWETRAVAFVLSAVASVLMCLNGLAYLFFDNIFVNIAVYAIAIFIIQLFLDMNLIKKIIASALEYIDIDKLVGIILGKLGITVDKIRKILDALKVTKDKLTKALRDAGVSEKVIEKIIKILYESDAEKKEEKEEEKKVEG